MKINIKLTTTYLLLFSACFFLSGHSYSIIVGSGVDMAMLLAGFISCALLYPLLHLPRRINAEGAFVICIAIGAVLSYILYYRQNMWLDPLLLLGKIALAYLISQRLSFNKFAKLFVNAIAFVSAIAISATLLLQAGLTIPSYTYIGANGMVYHTIWLCSWLDPSVGIPRLMGPFWEPGLYSSVAIYALLCEGCFTGEKPRKLPMAVILIGIFFAYSTAGYVLTLLAIYIVFFQAKRKRAICDAITIFIIIIIFLSKNRIVEALANWNYDVFWKFTEQNISANTRLFSPIACLQVFLQNPLTGLGMSYATNQYNLYKPVFGIDSLTSTNTFMLAAFGIWGISYTIFLCRGIFRQKQFAVTTRILLLVLMLVIVNKEPHTSILFTYIMMFYLNKNCNEVLMTNVDSLKLGIK